MRTTPQGDDLIVAPADGKLLPVVEAAPPAELGLGDTPRTRLSIFMNVFNVHSNRASVTGRVRAVHYFPGLFVNADLDKASTENERNAVIIDTPVDGQNQVVTLVQVAGLIARRILCYVHPGDALDKGQRYGFIRFGSRVDVYLPLTATPRAAVGDKVYATESVLAVLP